MCWLYFEKFRIYKFREVLSSIYFLVDWNRYFAEKCNYAECINNRILRSSTLMNFVKCRAPYTFFNCEAFLSFGFAVL